MPTCVQCGEPVKDEPGETTVIYNVPDDVFLCDESCENKRRVEDASVERESANAVY